MSYTRKVRLVLPDQSVSMQQARKIIQKILEQALDLSVRVSPGAWDRDDFTTYVLESPERARPRGNGDEVTVEGEDIDVQVDVVVTKTSGGGERRLR